MKKIAFLVAVVSALPLVATAGERISPGVYVDNSGRQASGSLGTARNSTSTVERIGCRYSGGTTPYVYCWARNTASTFGYCITYNPSPALTNAVASMNGDSRVAFTWDGAYTCTSLDVEHDSALEPKR